MSLGVLHQLPLYFSYFTIVLLFATKYQLFSVYLVNVEILPHWQYDSDQRRQCVTSIFFNNWLLISHPIHGSTR